MANNNPSPATRFKPGAGWRGNASGRPQGLSFTARLRQILERDSGDRCQLADEIAEVLVKKACRGELRAIELVLERTEGKVAHRLIADVATRERDIEQDRRDLERTIAALCVRAQVVPRAEAGGNGEPKGE
jgi:hypothetical protein